MRWLLLIGVLACGGGVASSDVSLGDGGAGVPGPPGALDGPPKLSSTIVSGYAFDGRTGKPLGNVTVTTEPPLETIRTNQQGAYVIDAGQAFGRLTVRAARDGYQQRQVACVTLKPGRSAIADLTLVAQSPSGGAACSPDCDAASTCLDGVCVSRCNPPCGCNERCTVAAACEPDPDAPPAGTCGAHAIALGAGVCQCQSGYTPTGDGRSCTVPSALSCPKGATASGGGACVCDAGLVPTPAGDACVAADELAVVAPLADVLVGRRIAVSAAAPRGVAFDGTRLWVGDAAAREVGEVDGTRTIALGGAGIRLADLAAGPGGLYAVFAGDPSASDRSPTLALLNPESGAVTPVAANDFDASPGLAFDGLRLASLEGNRLVRRSPDLGQLVAFSTLELDSELKLSVEPPGLVNSYTTPPVAFLALTANRALAWQGSVFDGTRWLIQLAVLNAAHPTRAARVDTLSLDLGGSHVRGLEATGTTAWVLVDGAGVANGPELPAIVELSLE